jgi:cbb3-type cytochrome c oxidase subunit II
MSRAKHSRTGWQGASLVAITYVYFLIFAQFAFLKKLANLGIADAHLKLVMAAMAAGGILLSLLTPRVSLWPAAHMRLRIGLATCGVAALIALLPLCLGAAIAVSFLIGAGLGLLTVTLVTHLRQWIGDRDPLLAVAMGTGAGYLVCNIPGFFNASIEVQAVSAGALCLAGVAITLLPSEVIAESAKVVVRPAISFPRALAGFTAVVWLDSAAFFIIQNTPLLKAGTWQGPIHLWANGLLHFCAALVSAWLLRRRGLSAVLVGAFAALGIACLLLLDSERALLASLFYPIGVSLYSVALVAYPSLLAPAASTAERGRMAGWIYAVAGWAGSAMGIGMGQNLGHVPVVFVAAAGAVILLPQLVMHIRQRVREVSLVAVAMLIALLLYRIPHAPDVAPQRTQVERGRQVYISEGCIHCHSQYVRPNSADVSMWGPVETMQDLRQQNPPLIGNRRQGPDLSEVGLRRSALWLKAHFYNPAEVSGSSIMPSYGFLFRDKRGDDLVAYLESLRTGDTAKQLTSENLWHPSASAIAQATAADGERLYMRDCANCHSANGSVRREWLSNFKRSPSDLARGPYVDLPSFNSPQQRVTRLEQIAKFGIPGTDMPGHEYLSDRDIASIGLWLSRMMAQPNQQPQEHRLYPGDQP